MGDDIIEPPEYADHNCGCYDPGETPKYTKVVVTGNVLYNGEYILKTEIGCFYHLRVGDFDYDWSLDARDPSFWIFEFGFKVFGSACAPCAYEIDNVMDGGHAERFDPPWNTD